MHRPRRSGERQLRDQYDALLGAQVRIAKTVVHTKALIAAASAAIDRTRTTLADRSAAPPTPPQTGDRARG